MRNRTYGGVRGRKTKVGRKLSFSSYSINPFFLFMKHIIDIDTWERRDNYGFFRTFLNSWYSVTTEIDCTEASAAAKQSGHSFFLYYLYAVLRSANEVDELRYRTDKNGPVSYTHLTLPTIA